MNNSVYSNNFIYFFDTHALTCDAEHKILLVHQHAIFRDGDEANGKTVAPVAQPLGVYKTPGMLRYIALVECYVTRQPRGGEDLQGLCNRCHKIRGSETA